MAHDAVDQRVLLVDTQGGMREWGRHEPERVVTAVPARRIVLAAMVALSLPATGCQAILGIKDPTVGIAGDGAVPDAVRGGGDGSVSPDGWSGNPDAQNVAYGTPTARGDLAMGYDAATKRVILFGGTNPLAGSLLNDTWAWDGTGWTKVTPPASPPGREDHGMTYDAARGKVVLFGGYDGLDELDDTWEWNGTGWTDVTPTTRPMARAGLGMAYDAARGDAVAFGGVFGPNYLDDTWAWDGTRWTNVTPATMSPSGRVTTMAYDAMVGVTVLFGGYDGKVLQDTWEWNGTDWTNITPATGNPPARGFSAMAYDAALGKVVLFGGQDARGELLDDTWEWDGSGWTNATPASGNPPARFRHAMAYDAATQRVILFGGDDAAGNTLEDTWAWDGTKWSKR